jgi:hypothetical protein
MLVRLMYASRAPAPPSAEIIESILGQARTRNPSLGITGILCFSNEIYLQVLEGGRRSVNDLYHAIARDPRHHEITMLQYHEISERAFAGWTMGQVNLSRVNPSLMLKYSERPALDPFAVSGRASMALLEELMATAQIIGRAG